MTIAIAPRTTRRGKNEQDGSVLTRRTPTALATTVALASALVAGMALTGCGSHAGAAAGTSTGTTGSTGSSTGSSSGGSTVSSTGTSGASGKKAHHDPAPTTTRPAPTTTTTVVPGAVVDGWTVVSADSHGIVTDERTVQLPDGNKVTLVRWHAHRYTLALHFGSEDPPSSGLAVTGADGDAISASEQPRLIGAFNGGFKVDTGSGGFEADGITAVPLVTGDASFVIDRNGSAHIGTWGQGLPAPGEQVVSVRQNLQLLVANGAPTANAGNPADWGATLGGVEPIARSAAGMDPAGDLIYAGSMDALPADMATALVQAGASTAMELDINPYWVQCDTAVHPGGALTAAIPGQNRPADTYLSGWTRDFFTVLAAG